MRGSWTFSPKLLVLLSFPYAITSTSCPVLISDSLRWYAVETQPRVEKAVCSVLRNKGYELFLPLYQSRRRWSDRIKELELALFPGYLFCRLSAGQRTLPLLTTPGVRRIVGVGRTPVPIPDEEIAAVQAIMRSGCWRNLGRSSKSDNTFESTAARWKDWRAS